jgi:protein-S-isoprenylcysteine O-methyltransferase Ste14
MRTVVRHLLAVLVLPATVAIFVPLWIARRYAVTFGAPTDVAGWLLLVCGVAFLAVGLGLFCASLYNLVTHGRGTLAPWDPPRQLVVRGPYRFVRNPMISGVIFVLFGEALVSRSLPHAAWAAAFLVLNAIYIPLVEEPQLEARFGEPYSRYRRHVARFLPRLRPWSPDDA